MNPSSSVTRVHLSRVEEPDDLFELFAATDPSLAPILLDGAPGVSEGRYTVFVSGPSRVHLLERDPVGIEDVELARHWLAPLRIAPRSISLGGDVPEAIVDELPFLGGWVGSLDYEAGGAFAHRAGASRKAGRPELGWFGFYPRGLCRDEERGETYAFRIEGEEPGRVPQTSTAPRSLAEIPWGGDGENYRRGVSAVQARIGRGEIYQANLCTPFLRALYSREEVLTLAREIRRVGRSPYGAFLQRPGHLVLSNSPELLFTLRGDRLRAQPIKGTRPRDPSHPPRDRALRDELARSAKDRAELVMIVDLYRNDLGRVARPGSVRVEGGLQVRSYSRVHHLMADVTARAREGVDAVDVLLALYPAGSITGAPKRQAMCVIDDLEGAPRGTYTGSVGMIDVRGRATFDVAIRTAEWRAGVLELHMGAGIVADSDPAAEYAELHAKAAAWRMALGRDVPVLEGPPGGHA